MYHTTATAASSDYKENDDKPVAFVNEPAKLETSKTRDTTSDKLAQIEQLLNMSVARCDRDEVLN